MPAGPFPGRDPLRRFGTTCLLAALVGALAVVVAMVAFALGASRAADEWMLGLGFCFLFGGAAGGQAHAVLLDHRARIESLEKRSQGDPDRPAAGP